MVQSAIKKSPYGRISAMGGFVLYGSLSIVGVGFVKIPPQFYEKGSFYV